MGEAGDGAPTVVANRYRVSELLGSGAWGIVYRAIDMRNDREVALKILRVEFAGSASVDRFRREIAILARLDHPNIVALYDSGEIEGAPWYAMSYVRGESLQERLAREKSLPIIDALNIAREVAVALAHAHAAGVVHRDIKPGNILLQDGRVFVADFGIARAISGAAREEWKSSSGFQIGTPGYMSPEQVAAEATIDGRSDIYSTGCVLYEMLAGEKPFSGSSPTALMARHIFDPVPRLSTVRRALPKSVEAVVYRALAKSAADRFGSATEFAQVLEAVAKDPQTSVAQSPRKARRAALATIAVAALVAGAFTARPSWERAADARAVAAADTTRVVVFPFDREAAVAPPLDVAQSILLAMLRWKGLDLVDPSSLSEAMGSKDGTAVTASELRAVALRLHAGRFVRGRVWRDGDSTRVQAMLFDVSLGERPLFETSGTISSNSAANQAMFAALTDRLLLRARDSTESADGANGTSSLGSRQAYLRGKKDLERWDLQAADSDLASALRLDAHNAAAALWLALSRNWAEKDTATWFYAAEAAASRRADLSASDQAKLDALAALAHGDQPRACRQWDAQTRQAPFDFAVWYGAADCLLSDNVVLPDATSPSGWKFRSGYHSALVRYQRAFALRPAVLRALRHDAFGDARALLKTSGNDLRMGVSLGPMPNSFAAFPSWESDTLCFVPFSFAVIASSDARVLRRLPRTVGIAVREQRQLFREIAAGWSASDRESAEAAHALALALFLLGEPSAIDTLMRAKSLAADQSERQRIATSEVWMRLQFALPGDAAALRRARELADSLLRSRPADPVDPKTLASIAALTGHAFEVVRLQRDLPTKVVVPGSIPVRALSRTLLYLAAFGGPADSLLALERRTDSLIAAVVAPDQRDAARREALSRADALAMPELRMHSIQSFGASQPSFLDGDVALARGDTAGARAALASVRNMRGAFDFPELTVDAIYPEAWLLAATGDTLGAIAWLDPVLARVRLSSSLVDPVRAAMLVRAMAFRAELAAATGDRRGAAQWAAAVVELWSGADSFLQPVVIRMRALSAAGG